LIYASLVALAFAIVALKLSCVHTFKGLLSSLVIKVGKISYSMNLQHFLLLQIFSWLMHATVF
jgi:peptidoglycan/LPS O-acetylase OafA/YrhL